jgi:murein DD-endopeptidase MepM/ murein hydrolase activator NlpD
MRFRPRIGLRGALVVAVAVAASVPAPALAATGGTTAPPGAGSGTGSGSGTAAGGTAYAPGAQAPKPPKKKRPASRPVLTSFGADASRFYDLGRPARVAFRIDGRSRTVRVKLQILRGGTAIRTIDLGDRATGRSHSVALTGREGGRLPEGELQLRLTARDPRGRGLRASGRASSTDALAFYWHRFPLTGRFDYGGEGSRFGADRPGHVHQGQDLTAPEGTPVIAPRAGVVRTVEYQAGGAGYYVVVEGDGEDRSYVFMHLREGSTLVAEGERVRTGQRLGDVGSTGSSSGPHLHFEIWVGAWYAGGSPIDPLPDLLSWDRWS